jgi:photosystem II stability/assembly factor-like uncharacterized protein
VGFESARLGWITACCPTATDAVPAPTDGGTRWNPLSLPAVAQACQQRGCEIPAPKVAGRSVFFVVADGGQTWRADLMPIGAESYPRVAFFTAQGGLAVAASLQRRIGRACFLTTNGGPSWTAVCHGLRFGGNWDDFDSISPCTGFGRTYLGTDPVAAGPRLYRTASVPNLRFRTNLDILRSSAEVRE